MQSFSNKCGFYFQKKHHDTFQQVGDELCTLISVPTMKAKRGCPITINLLDSDTPIDVFVKLEEIRKSRNIIRIKGSGWPKLDTRGDLVIHVNDIPDKKVGPKVCVNLANVTSRKMCSLIMRGICCRSRFNLSTSTSK